jgi:hypothetical protein
VPLTAQLKTVADGNDILVHFNRAPDDALVAELEKLAASVSAQDDRRDWVVGGTDKQSIRALLVQFNVGGRDKSAAVTTDAAQTFPEIDVEMRVHNDRITLGLKRGAMPTLAQLSKIKSVLSQASVNVVKIKGMTTTDQNQDINDMEEE